MNRNLVISCVAALAVVFTSSTSKADEEYKGVSPLPGLTFSGYVQPQFVWQSFNNAASPNPAGVAANDTTGKTDGTTTNTDVFRLRRARLKTTYMPTDYMRLTFEIDPTPTGGPTSGVGTIARQVEATGIARWSDDVSTEFSAGIFKLPFGYEVLQSDADRPFIERSWGEQNLTPGEFDTGAESITRWGDGSFQFAVVNGQTQGEKTFAVLPDLNHNKDFVGRLHYKFDCVDFGVSGYAGTGQTVDTKTLAVRNFNREAVNAEVGLHHKFVPEFGNTKVFSEFTWGQNMDRGVKYAFALPNAGQNLNEMNVWIRGEQELGKYFAVGARYDVYSPNVYEFNNFRHTFSGVGVVRFTKGLQYMAEFDHAVDGVHPLGVQAPNRQTETVSGVLQARF